MRQAHFDGVFIGIDRGCRIDAQRLSTNAMIDNCSALGGTSPEAVGLIALLAP